MSGFTFAHVSDLHLPFEPTLTPRQHLSKRQLSVWSWQRRRALHRTDILDALAADLRAHAPDHILVTGDITNFSLPAEFEQAARWLAALGPTENLSLVPGNHDALVKLAPEQGLGLWADWTRAEEGWPYLHRRGDVAFIGLDSALPTPLLLARGRLGSRQLERLEHLLATEGAAGRTRVVMLHHPPARGAVQWRKALADAAGLRAVLQRAGAELVLHGHARDARLDALPGPGEPIPCLCVPSSSAVPNPKDQGALWHRLCLSQGQDGPSVRVEVRRWSSETGAFVADGGFTLALPRRTGRRAGENIALRHRP